jgi:hypothetical protein
MEGVEAVNDLAPLVAMAVLIAVLVWMMFGG